EVQQGDALAIAVGVDQRFVRGNCRIGNRACRGPLLNTQVRSLEVARDALDSNEVESLVPLNRSPDRAAELFAMEFLELGAVGHVPCQPLEALKVEDGAVNRVRARLRATVACAAGRAPDLGGRAGGDPLNLFARLERDVDGHALPARLLAEEPVVV